MNWYGELLVMTPNSVAMTLFSTSRTQLHKLRLLVENCTRILMCTMFNELMTIKTDKLYEYIDTLYWLGDRTIAPTDYNINIFDYLAQVNEEDYE